MNQVDRNQTLLQLQVSLPKRVILTVLIMAMLIMFVFFFNIPNPNMILIAGLVICSALFGYGGGVVAGAIMFFYTLYFFSRGMHARSFACASTLMTTRTFPADSARLVDSADGQTGNP